jgi:hypothetical protein
MSSSGADVVTLSRAVGKVNGTGSGAMEMNSCD